MIIYRTWDSYDMANSDTYWPTLQEAIADIKDSYGVKGPIKLDENGWWSGKAGPDAGHASNMDVHIQRLDIETTREGLCHALKMIPHR